MLFEKNVQVSASTMPRARPPEVAADADIFISAANLDAGAVGRKLGDRHTQVGCERANHHHLIHENVNFLPGTYYSPVAF